MANAADLLHAEQAVKQANPCRRRTSRRSRKQSGGKRIHLQLHAEQAVKQAKHLVEVADVELHADHANNLVANADVQLHANRGASRRKASKKSRRSRRRRASRRSRKQSGGKRRRSLHANLAEQAAKQAKNLAEAVAVVELHADHANNLVANVDVQHLAEQAVKQANHAEAVELHAVNNLVANADVHHA